MVIANRKFTLNIFTEYGKKIDIIFIELCMKEYPLPTLKGNNCYEIM